MKDWVLPLLTPIVAALLAVLVRAPRRKSALERMRENIKTNVEFSQLFEMGSEERAAIDAHVQAGLARYLTEAKSWPSKKALSLHASAGRSLGVALGFIGVSFVLLGTGEVMTIVSPETDIERVKVSSALTTGGAGLFLAMTVIWLVQLSKQDAKDKRDAPDFVPPLPGPSTTPGA